MSEPYLSEIRIMSFGFPPTGWALCNGQLLPIAQNEPLFDLIGTNYGGDGVRTFALPNLQGRVPLHMSGDLVIGEFGGEASHALTVAEMPGHAHSALGTATAGDSPLPAGNYLAAADGLYAPPDNLSATVLAPTTLSTVGNGLAHDNLQPYLVLNFYIALTGIFPTRS